MAKLSRSEFQRALSKLKAAGILSAETDVRRAQPWWTRAAGPRGGRYHLSELIEKYDAVVSDKATVVHLPKEATKKFKKLDYETTRGGGIIVPHSAVQKVEVKGDSFAVVNKQAGIERLQIPVEYHNLEEYLSELRKDKKALQKMKKRGEYFAFNYYGGHSKIYESIDHLLEELLHYEGVQAAIRKDDARTMNEIYRNLEIVTTTKSSWKKSKSAARTIAKEKSHHVKGERKRKLVKLKKGPKWKLDQYRAERAKEAREYRAKMSPAQKAEASRKAAQRRSRK